MNRDSAVTIYTDGACSGNPGPGGWAAILMYNGHKKTISGAQAETTNNRMELMAAIEGIKALKRPCNVRLYTDSAYLYNAFTQDWLSAWQRNNWKRGSKSNQPVANVDLWEQLVELAKIHFITWIKVKGHSDNAFNNECDKVARAAITELKNAD